MENKLLLEGQAICKTIPTNENPNTPLAIGSADAMEGVEVGPLSLVVRESAPPQGLHEPLSASPLLTLIPGLIQGGSIDYSFTHPPLPLGGEQFQLTSFAESPVPLPLPS